MAANGSIARPAYYNGAFCELDEVRIPALDRGFLFGDAVYELIPVYGGRPFRLSSHLRRLGRSLEETRIPGPMDEGRWEKVIRKLVDSAGGGDLSVYLQVTRGVAARDHAFPDTEPTVFAMVNPLNPPAPEVVRTGVSAITLPDIRWRRCDIKTTSLLGNVLLRQQAVEHGAVEAILLRDGFAVEGAATNVFVVSGGEIITPPDGADLLPGVTRDLIVELALAHGLPCSERRIPQALLRQAQEVWITSSSKEVLAVTTLDDRPVGKGRPGPVWERVYRLVQDYKRPL